jgi:beta-mannosidase
MEDPFWRDNELDALALMEHDYVFERTLILHRMLEGDALILTCLGLDTLCEVRINDQLVLTANNMHRTWEVDVKEHVRMRAITTWLLCSFPTVCGRSV